MNSFSNFKMSGYFQVERRKFLLQIVHFSSKNYDLDPVKLPAKKLGTIGNLKLNSLLMLVDYYSEDKGGGGSFTKFSTKKLQNG